jgi:nucleoside-diphosphate-sugar epimerase
VLALEHDGPAIYNVVDDEPAPAREWLPEVARIVSAKPPQRFPRLLARLFAGAAPVVMGTESRGASNAKAKRELGWTLRYPSWRHGFAAAYAEPAATSAPRPPVASAWRAKSTPR